MGVVKEMVRIPTLDTPETETSRYAEAGAETVVAVPRDETVIFVRKRLTLEEILPHLKGLDFVLLEGFDSEKALPRIAAAKTAAEAVDFCGKSTIAISGVIVESEEEVAKAVGLKPPLLSSSRDAGKIADIIENRSISI